MKNEIIEIYSGKTGMFNRELKLLQEQVKRPRNRELIQQFQEHLFAKNCGENRVTKVSGQLRRICRYLRYDLEIDVDLDKLTKTNLISLITFINRRLVKSEATKADYRTIVKQFFRWFKDEDIRVYSKDEEQRITAQKFYNFIEKEINCSYKLEKIDPSQIITDEDCDRVVKDGCRTPREKAFVMLLHESGMRAGEFLNLRIRDISFKGIYANLRVPSGKTGSRHILVYRSVPFIQRHLECHRYRDIPHSFLWLSESRHPDHSKDSLPIRHKGSQKLIDRCFKRAGVSKRHNLHWFRHSRCSILAPKMTETMLKQYFGWSMSSRQIKNYAHLCRQQLEDVLLSIHGIKTKEENQSMPITCTICGMKNHPEERYCSRCYRPLKTETLMQDQELIKSETGKTINFFMQIVENPELMQKFKEFKKQMS